MTKKLTDLTVTELKVASFDTDNEIKRLQSQYSALIQQLNVKLQEEQSKSEPEECFIEPECG